MLWRGQVAREGLADLAVWAVERPLVEPFTKTLAPLHRREHLILSPDTEQPKGERVVHAGVTAFRKPVHEGNHAMALAPDRGVGEEAQDLTAWRGNSRNLSHNGVEVGDVLHDLIADDQIEVRVGEWDRLVHRNDSTALHELVDALAVHRAAESGVTYEGVAAVSINAQGEHLLDHLSATASVVENAASVSRGEVGAEVVIVHAANGVGGARSAEASTTTAYAIHQAVTSGKRFPASTAIGYLSFGNSNAAIRAVNNWMYQNNKTER